jgi:hypothetical protein
MLQELSVECNASDSNGGGALSTEDDTVNMNNYDNHNSDRAYYHDDADANSNNSDQDDHFDDILYDHDEYDYDDDDYHIGISSGGGRVSTGSGGGR